MSWIHMCSMCGRDVWLEHRSDGCKILCEECEAAEEDDQVERERMME